MKGQDLASYWALQVPGFSQEAQSSVRALVPGAGFSFTLSMRACTERGGQSQTDLGLAQGKTPSKLLNLYEPQFL